MTPGDVLIAANKLYGGSITQFGRSIQRFGWECVFVDTDDLSEVSQKVDLDIDHLCTVNSF